LSLFGGLLLILSLLLVLRLLLVLSLLLILLLLLILRLWLRLRRRRCRLGLTDWLRWRSLRGSRGRLECYGLLCRGLCIVRHEKGKRKNYLTFGGGGSEAAAALAANLLFTAAPAPPRICSRLYSCVSSGGGCQREAFAAAISAAG